jgi:uncharacterized protein (DUF362 family)
MNRRKFLGSSLKALCGLGFLPFVGCGKDNPVQQSGDDDAIRSPRQGVPNPFVSGGKPILVSVTGGESFAQRLDAGMAELGGFHTLLSHGGSLLIKPNLNSIDTYPAIINPVALAYLVKKVNEVTPTTVNVGDAPWSPPQSVYDHVGLENAVESEGGQVIHFNGYRQVRAPHWESSRSESHVYQQVYDAGVIISLACLKRHYRAVFTCAIKNNVGTIASPGGNNDRAYLHSLSGDPFLREVAEIANLVRPDLSIVDATSALTVSGPTTNQGVVVHGIDTLVICGDMVATDLYCANLMAQYDSTFTPDMISTTLDRASELGLGENNLANVDVREIHI